MRYTYKEFLNFCNAQNQNIRLDGDVVWYGKIPVPESLIKRVFFEAESLLSIYLDHLISAYAIQTFQFIEKIELIQASPSPEISTKISNDFPNLLEIARRENKFRDIEDFIAQASGLQSYQKITTNKLVKVLNHKGKKYERIYVPHKIKDFIQISAPKLNLNIGVSNGDMFGNVIADEFKIYRSGFSDAFAGVFKEYLEFKFEYFGNLDPSLSNLGVVQKLDYEKAGSVVLSKNMQGALWEPRLAAEHGVNVILNQSHPFLLNEKFSHEERLDMLMLAFAHEEMHLMNDADKELIEEFRLRISNWLKEFSD